MSLSNLYLNLIGHLILIYCEWGFNRRAKEVVIFCMSTPDYYTVRIFAWIFGVKAIIIFFAIYFYRIFAIVYLHVFFRFYIQFKLYNHIFKY